MADFRKWILALTVLVLFAGLASAQTGIVCTANAVPPQLRGEGFTEQVGDILLSCSGLNPGQTANFTVFLNQTVTSRIYGSTSNTAGQFPSEALLLVNDPPAGSQVLCGATVPTVPVTCAGTNVVQGYVSGSSVSFYGVPVLPPNTAGGNTTYRITNVRINANGLNGGGNIPNPAQAAITISSSTSIQVNNSFLTVGYVTNSLKTSVNNPATASSNPLTGGASNSTLTFQQCVTSYKSTTSPTALATLAYTELQGSAFKPRGTTMQNTPGAIYYTESGFTFPVSSSAYAGYADWGTRLRATFNNIPSGVSLYVSTVNLLTAPNGIAGTTSSSFAQLIQSETAPWSSITGIPIVPSTGSVNGIPFTVLSPVNGSAEAVWEVTNSIATVPENFYFQVFLSYTPNTASNMPTAPSTMTVNMSYAPIYPPATGAVASSSLGEPRFFDSSTATNALLINICQTALLYPYVVNTAGFDTGLAVANTTADPFGTSAQSGSCTINWYGSNPPATNPGFLGANNGYTTTAPTSANYIAAGTISAWQTSVVAPGFSGYVIAVCNFQYAHGFAFVSDLGARNLAMGYLADVLNTPIGGRTNAPAGSEANGQ
jgi:hypothetical protein